MQIGHVNVGGIAQPRLQEVKQWALHQAIDILLLSETRWSFEAEWCDPHWYHIHTGTSSDKADGLLFLIRRTVCQPDQIGFAFVFPGRIGHLRIHFHKRAFDLNIQQHAVQLNKTCATSSGTALRPMLPKYPIVMQPYSLVTSIVV